MRVGGMRVAVLRVGGVRFRGVLGSLVVVPIVILLWGTTWSFGDRSIDHRWLVPGIWGVWGVLAVARIAAPGFSAARRALAGWERIDLGLAALLVHGIVFQLPRDAGFALMSFAPVVGLVWIARRAPLATALYAAVVGGILFYVFPKVISARMFSRIAQVHDLSVDHRLAPDGEEINADGIRFRGDPADLNPEDFVVLFLGDSFTYGHKLNYSDSYPYVFEDYLNRSRCTARVRAVNFGWLSSSPLLSLRLLREVGYRYQPDLVVYSLDVTDFHDDLRYQRELHRMGDLELDWAEVANVLANTALPWGPIDVRGIFRFAAKPPDDDETTLPADRFFVTALPLEQTRPDIERGVMKNLAAMNDFTRDVLEIPFALVIYPRAYQYSRREAPRTWEDDRYQRLGPFVREPLNYIDQVADALPFPVIDLWPAFEGSTRFPLFFRNDPHWNRFGAALAAETAAHELSHRGLLPCTAQDSR